MLALQPHIDQACVIGDERPYCVALIVPAWDRLRQWAESRGLLTSDPASLAREPQVREILEAEVAEVNARLAPYETVKSFAVVIRPFTADEGLLTPTLKLRRKAVTAAYAEEIDRLYAQGSRPTR
jgi:long-chain acyl-CoA synthetase